MSNEELHALTALVNRESAMLNADVVKYGEVQWNPRTPAMLALDGELRARGIIKEPSHG